MMNSKQSVFAVLNKQSPDYIPIGMYAIDCDTVEKILGHKTYVRNKAGITLALWEGRRDEVVQSLKEDSVELFKKLDIIDLIIPYKEASILPPRDYVPEKVKKLEDNIWEGENGTIYKLSTITNEIAPIKIEISNFTKADFEKQPKGVKPDDSMFEAYNHLVDAFKDTKFLAGKAADFEPLLIFGGLLGMDRGLMDYILRPELIKKAIDYTTEVQNQSDQYYVRDDIDAVFIEHDMAGSNGPLISPAMFEQFCYDSMKSRIESIKIYTDKVIFHCCGNTWEYMDMFTDSGIDAYQSLQTGAGMDIVKLKKQYGHKIAYWGGVTVETLVGGTSEQIRQEVRRTFESCRTEGGFILGPSHSIAFGTKYDNFMAMLDEYDKLKYN